MSLFSIKLKTRNGNDVKSKQLFNIVFKVKLKQNAITSVITGLYVYKIIYNNKIKESGNNILVLKNSTLILSKEDLIAKVMLNLLMIVAKITEKENINPDLIMLNSDDFDDCNPILESTVRSAFDGSTKIRRGKKSKHILDNDPFKLIAEFVNINSNTRFLIINPKKDELKYKKSLIICEQLKDKFKLLNTNNEI